MYKYHACTLDYDVTVVIYLELLCFQAGEKVLHIRTLPRFGLMEGVDNLSVLSHYEIASHNERIVIFIEFWKRQTPHLSLCITMQSKIGRYYANDPSQSQLPVHSPVWVTVSWQLN